ncbi:helix-hairpin-helix domain-containing protein [Streptococcus didelphis]|uniref:Helix-hairpin-helix domain-containing protein n=1 Tax=Streptococcus didelphis TaxID=102886 RepID=A0ABY9LGV1_9STRE|nr:helix-hairpin-helix domain-containing protein [Streptococcus didelphis]WMB28087.1 helix-hairpin-helix domain-containing protein [Streptococcus didelphis]
MASSSKATISKTGNPSQPDNKKVNLNNASLEELTKIPGIGEKRAKEIIENRDKLGGFKSLDDLLAISGIGQKTLDKLKDDVEVD